MYQSDRVNYRTKESFMHEFLGSCLGKLIVVAVVFCILALIAFISVPNEETMMLETVDNVCQCINSNDSIKSDKIDTFVDNVAFSFTHADTTLNAKELETFDKHNRIVYDHHPLYSTTTIVNNINPEGKLAGVGVFGMVFSTVAYRDLLLYVDKMRGDFNERIIQSGYYEEEYIGENPNVKPFHYKGDPTQ